CPHRRHGTDRAERPTVATTTTRVGAREGNRAPWRPREREGGRAARAPSLRCGSCPSAAAWACSRRVGTRPDPPAHRTAGTLAPSRYFRSDAIPRPRSCRPTPPPQPAATVARKTPCARPLLQATGRPPGRPLGTNPPADRRISITRPAPLRIPAPAPSLPRPP